MALLPIGNYTIRVDSQGFGPVEQKDVRLQVDERLRTEFHPHARVGYAGGRSQRQRGIG